MTDTAAKNFNISNKLSLLALIGANLIPLIGALFFDWNAILILALFWIENLIIGLFNIAKMATAGAYKKELKAIFLCGFFFLHYGMFCAVHGTILWEILGLEKLPNGPLNVEWFGIGEIFREGAVVFLSFVEMFKPQIWLGIAALFASHCIDFLENFILNQELKQSEAKDFMAKPYAQIFILHGGLIVGAGAVEKFGSPIWLLIVIIGFKLGVEFFLYKRKLRKQERHKKLKAL